MLRTRSASRRTSSAPSPVGAPKILYSETAQKAAPELGRQSGDVAAALAQLRGQAATAILQALERGDATAQQRAEKLLVPYSR